MLEYKGYHIYQPTNDGYDPSNRRQFKIAQGLRGYFILHDHVFLGSNHEMVNEPEMFQNSLSDLVTYIEKNIDRRSSLNELSDEQIVQQHLVNILNRGLSGCRMQFDIKDSEDITSAEFIKNSRFLLRVLESHANV